MMRRTVPLMAACCALAVGPLAGTAPRAQQPEARQVHAVTGYLSTPTREEFSPAVLNRLRVPAGFRVSVFAQDLANPRMMAVGDDGTVYVTRRDSNDVLALRDRDGDGRAEERRKVVSNLRDAHGIAVHGGRLYVATITEVHVADIRPDGSVGAPRAIVTDLPDGGQHPNRTIGVGPDGLLYVAVGSTCNACDEPNPEHATLLRLRADGSERAVHAEGLRNTVGFAWHPQTRELWGMDHGTDWRGNDVPPEELNRIQSGRHYGWPFCWGDRRVDSALVAEPPGGQTKAEFCRTTTAPHLTHQAHSAPMQMVFYTGTQFPADHRGDAFVAMRGSWNREPPVGYGVVRVRFRDGQPAAIEDFLTGFLAPGGRSYAARPAGIAVARDGALLVSDDTNGVIYRIAHGER